MRPRSEQMPAQRPQLTDTARAMNAAVTVELRQFLGDNGFFLSDLSRALKSSRYAIYPRISGKTPWTVEILQTICEYFELDLSSLIMCAERRMKREANDASRNSDQCYPAVSDEDCSTEVPA